jgi:hypothetical protein
MSSLQGRAEASQKRHMEKNTNFAQTLRNLFAAAKS